ncbi:MAG: pentapeptide repeat-containing protein [Candidatus Latescibacterota bacterium]
MTTTETPTCSYLRQDGTRCPAPVEGDGNLCFWHHPKVSKEQPGIRERLQEWAATGESMEGFVLRFANLEGVRLNSARGIDLRNATLFKARLPGASLWNVDLRGADLMKADLSGANLNEARLVGANILGAILDGTKLERTDWGDRVLQEHRAIEAEHAGDHDKARENYIEAEEIYRALRRAYDGVGRFVEAGTYFQGEMRMRRKLMPRWSVGRIWSKLVDIFCGYGEEPQRVIGFSLFVVFACAVAYFLMGVKGPEGQIGYTPGAGIPGNLLDYLNCVYYSVITFTTCGYGDIHPNPDSATRLVASAEAFTGAFMIALFVAVFGKKMTRG